MSKQFLPTTLSDFQVFFLNESWAGVVNKLTLPDIEFKTETFTSTATGGEKEKVLPILKALKPKINFSDYNTKVLSLVGTSSTEVNALTFRGSIDRDGVAVGVKIEMEGDWFKSSIGELTAGGQEAKLELEGSLNVYTIEIDGTEAVHVDLKNRVYRTDGVDHWATIRNQIAQS